MMVKKILILFFLILFFSSPSFSQPESRRIKKPRHFIFLIHGIGGNKTHFGEMRKALSSTLLRENPQVEYIVDSFEYETGHDEKTPYDFAIDFAQELKQEITDHPDQWNSKQDRISLLMHSQGGLVGSIWLFQSLSGNPAFSPNVAGNVDAFITLGTPFWGAKMAEFGQTFFQLSSRIGIDIPLPFGDRELEEMSFGSDTIHDFRNALIDLSKKDIIDFIKKNIRTLNIAAVARVLNPLGLFVSGGQDYEDDGAVPLSCAKFNFLYVQSFKEKYQKNDIVKSHHIKEINLAPFLAVDALHRSPLPEVDPFWGIAQAPRACIADAHCSHPSFQYIWKHLLGQKVNTSAGIPEEDFKSFLIDLNIRVPGFWRDIPWEDFIITFLNREGGPLNREKIEIVNSKELYSSGQKRSKKNSNHYRFYYSGNIYQKGDGPKMVIMKIELKNFKTRIIEMILKKSYSTYVDVNLVSDSEKE